MSFFTQNDACMKLCNYLYLWIKSEIVDKVEKNGIFSEGVKALYKVLESNRAKRQWKCNYNSVNKENFKNMKSVFDYFNYQWVFSENLEYHQIRCAWDYKNSLDDAVTTYDSVYDFCIKNRCESYYASIVNFIPAFLCEKKLTSLKRDLQETHSYMDSLVSFTTDTDLNLTSNGWYSEIFMSILFELWRIILIYFLLRNVKNIRF